MTIGELRTRVVDVAGVELAVLFGSRARGQEHSGSDVDIALRISSGASRPAVEDAVTRALPGPVDIVDMDGAPPFLRFQIARDGVPLVERAPGAWTDFKARAMIDWWDWAPTERRILAAAVARVREAAHR